jgi:hypothetical protein
LIELYAGDEVLFTCDVGSASILKPGQSRRAQFLCKDLPRVDVPEKAKLRLIVQSFDAKP